MWTFLNDLPPASLKMSSIFVLNINIEWIMIIIIIIIIVDD